MRRIIPILALGVFFALAVFFVKSRSSSGQGRPGTGASPPATPVSVDAVSRLEFVPSAPLLGTTEPHRRSVVAASIEGYVIEFPVEEGQSVEEGQVLARMRTDILELRRSEARAALEETRALHAQSERDLARARELSAKEAVTEKTLDAAVTQERTLALRIPQGEARIQILEAEIAKKTVRAPFAGAVVAEHTEVGEWLSPGSPVATVLDLRSVFVRVGVAERHVRFVSEGAEVDIVFRALDERKRRGRIVSVSEDGDRTTRRFSVRVEVENPGDLRAGMSALVTLPTGTAREALLVHKDGILKTGAAESVYVVGPGGVAIRRSVRTGDASGTRFEVLEGLAEGERVIVRGNERLRPGQPVRIVPLPGSANGTKPGAGSESSPEPSDEGADGVEIVPAVSDGERE